MEGYKNFVSLLSVKKCTYRKKRVFFFSLEKDNRLGFSVLCCFSSEQSERCANWDSDLWLPIIGDNFQFNFSPSHTRKKPCLAKRKTRRSSAAVTALWVRCSPCQAPLPSWRCLMIFHCEVETERGDSLQLDTPSAGKQVTETAEGNLSEDDARKEVQAVLKKKRRMTGGSEAKQPESKKIKLHGKKEHEVNFTSTLVRFSQMICEVVGPRVVVELLLPGQRSAEALGWGLSTRPGFSPPPKKKWSCVEWSHDRHATHRPVRWQNVLVSVKICQTLQTADTETRFLVFSHCWKRTKHFCSDLRGAKRDGGWQGSSLCQGTGTKSNDRWKNQTKVRTIECTFHPKRQGENSWVQNAETVGPKKENSSFWSANFDGEEQLPFVLGTDTFTLQEEAADCRDQPETARNRWRGRQTRHLSQGKYQRTFKLFYVTWYRRSSLSFHETMKNGIAVCFVLAKLFWACQDKKGERTEVVRKLVEESSKEASRREFVSRTHRLQGG